MEGTDNICSQDGSGSLAASLARHDVQMVASLARHDKKKYGSIVPPRLIEATPATPVVNKVGGLLVQRRSLSTPIPKGTFKEARDSPDAILIGITPPPGGKEDQISNLRAQFRESKYAKLHKISAARVDQAIHRMQAPNNASLSGIDVCVVAGSSKLFVKMANDSQVDSATENGEALFPLNEARADPRSRAVPEQ